MWHNAQSSLFLSWFFLNLFEFKNPRRPNCGYWRAFVRAQAQAHIINIYLNFKIYLPSDGRFFFFFFAFIYWIHWFFPFFYFEIILFHCTSNFNDKFHSMWTGCSSAIVPFCKSTLFIKTSSTSFFAPIFALQQQEPKMI